MRREWVVELQSMASIRIGAALVGLSILAGCGPSQDLQEQPEFPGQVPSCV